MISLDEEIVEHDVNEVIQKHMGFIINTVSSVTGRYVSVENDGEFSIGLMTFLEAMEKYEEDRGSFLSFARLVIESRVKTFLNKENKTTVSIDALSEAGVEIDNLINNPIDDKDELIIEINKFKKELEIFNLTLEELAEESPKHKDTRRNAIALSEKISIDKESTTLIYDKNTAYKKDIFKI